MHESRPHLDRLLRASAETERDAAWADFLSEYSPLILHAARRASAGPDEVMDRYAYVLDRLREEDFRRLRHFSLNGTGKFTTWLVVVVRRLCIDHHRQVYGRDGSGADGAIDPDAVARRNLAQLITEELEPEQIRDTRSEGADAGLIRRERTEQLALALSTLDTRDRLLLTLRYVDGHAPERVARMLGFSSRFAVRRRLRGVLASLRRDLERLGFER